MTDVLLLPGVVLPAALAYGALLDALPEGTHAVAKDLELYAADELPAGYTLDIEGDGIRRAAAEAGFERFHLAGYSAGGAAALRFATLEPERLLSLTLLEPAWAGNQRRTPAEQELQAEFAHAMALPAEERMRAFVGLQLAPGVEPPAPPPGPPPPWMASRPAGVVAVTAAFAACELDLRRSSARSCLSSTCSAAAAIRTGSLRSPTASPPRCPTSRSRSSRTGITSTRPTVPSPSASPARSPPSGRAPTNRDRVRPAAESVRTARRPAGQR